MEEEKMITIKLSHYNALLEDRTMLNALDAAGVDNWDGYDYALDIFAENNKGDTND